MYFLQAANVLSSSKGHQSGAIHALRILAPALPRGVATREHTSIMQRFRSTWLALMGVALLVTLSIPAAFGAAPTGTHDATRGQTIASFVHQIVFGADEEPEDEPQLDEEFDENELGEETDEADAHGECVSAVAQDQDAIGRPNENHGGAVSEAARVTCWETEEEEETEEVTDPDEEEEADSHGACVSEVARDESAIGGKNNNHGGAVSEAARVTCRGDTGEDEPGETVDETGDDELAQTEAASVKRAAKAEEKAEKQAAKADRGGGMPSSAGGNGKSGDNGRGGGRP